MRTRAARVSDRDALALFATDTFDWGDYVLDSLERWLIDEQSAVRVAVDSDDRAVAVSQASMLSDTERDLGEVDEKIGIENVVLSHRRVWGCPYLTICW